MVVKLGCFLSSDAHKEMAQCFSKLAMRLSGFTDLKKQTNLQSTLNKTRSKADLQPLHKDSPDINKPMDTSTVSVDKSMNQNLSHIEDKRLTHYKPRIK